MVVYSDLEKEGEGRGTLHSTKILSMLKRKEVELHLNFLLEMVSTTRHSGHTGGGTQWKFQRYACAWALSPGQLYKRS